MSNLNDGSISEQKLKRKGEDSSISEGEKRRKVDSDQINQVLKRSLSRISHMNKYTNLCFSWADKRPDIIAEHYRQTKGNCWVVSLYRQWFAMMRLAKRKTEGGLTITSIEAGVEPHILTSDGGIPYLESAIPFMEQYVGRMKVYHRPPLPPFDAFETFVQSLLYRNPVSVSVRDYKSYTDVKYQGILAPTELQRTADLYCTNSKSTAHSLLLVGEGVTIRNGERIHYWLLYDSGGDVFGECGFIRIAKHLGLILEVVDMQLDDDDDDDDGDTEDEDDDSDTELKDKLG